MPVRLDTGERRTPAITSGPPDAIPASVLVLIVPDGGGHDADAEVILIERAPRGHHPGEISFPGGRAAGNETAEATALREAAEEVGLNVEAAQVRIIGRLETFWISVSGYRVQPILAIAARIPELTPSPDEVASIVHAPLSAFLSDAPIQVVEADIRDFRLRYGAYPVAGHLVWGATARILGQLGAILG
jgi:8-oxo-dGTP pyrophosphatase MutT (NUDIX family)